MHLFLAAADDGGELCAELVESFPGGETREAGPSLFETKLAYTPEQSGNVSSNSLSALPHLAFVRQWLPFARPAQAESIRGWALVIAEAVIGVLPDNQPWALHLEPHYGAKARHHIGARAWHSATRGKAKVAQQSSADAPTPAAEAGRHRCKLIREALVEVLQKRRRHLLRQLRREPVAFGTHDSLVQLFLAAPDAGFISVAPAPLPFSQRHILSPFPKGEVAIASDQDAPSRAFAKLVEAELRMGRQIQPGETCVDLGAAPGSWTYTAVCRGARVISVDRSSLREDLMRSPQVKFHQGDAFAFVPRQPVDWLVCDVIAAPDQSAGLLLEWLRRGWCRQFVVTIKLKDSSGTKVLAELKRGLPALTRELFITRLCANKKEVCVFGVAEPRKPV